MRPLIMIALAVLVAGCTLTPCEEPLKTINGECCLDANGNGVCDQYDKEAECQLPYIRYQGGCCLDANGNRICDELESQDTATTTTTEPYVEATTTSATTTTLEGAASQSTTSSTMRRLRPTTTTTTTLPDVPPGKCYDSDGGIKPDVAGYAIGDEWAPPHLRVVKRDYCRDTQRVYEYDCEKDFLQREEVVCEGWTQCKGGRCCLPSGLNCKGSNECCSGECEKKLYISLCK